MVVLKMIDLARLSFKKETLSNLGVVESKPIGHMGDQEGSGEAAHPCSLAVGKHEVWK